MNRLSLQDCTQILSCLVAGNSMRATARLCDVSFNTVSELRIDVGAACFMLVKLYGGSSAHDERRYGPAECTGIMYKETKELLNKK